MAKKLHEVALTADERDQLRALTHRGVASARRIQRARILLLAADGLPDPRVAEAVGCCVATVENVRRRPHEAPSPLPPARTRNNQRGDPLGRRP